MRLVLVSNRLPVTIEKVDGNWTTRCGSGGLVSALKPALKRYGGMWIGWDGTHEHNGLNIDQSLKEFSKTAGFELRGVNLTPEEIAGYYHGFSNEIIWPLFHDLQTRCNFDPSYWETYKTVNHKFAEVIAANA